MAMEKRQKTKSARPKRYPTPLILFRVAIIVLGMFFTSITDVVASQDTNAVVPLINTNEPTEPIVDVDCDSNSYLFGALCKGSVELIEFSGDPAINPIDTVPKDRYTNHQYQAQWIWSNVQMQEPRAVTIALHDKDNEARPARFQFIRFRKEFELETMPIDAVALVAADTFYRLWINGHLVMHGPARSSVNKAAVDPLAVTKFLQTGQNKVEAAVCYLEDPGFEAFSKAPGFLCELEIKQGHKKIVVATDKTWEVCEIKAWNRESPQLSATRGIPLDDIDARLYSDEQYEPAVVLGKVGITPWTTVELRDIPLPAPLREVRPVRVVNVYRGDGSAPKTPPCLRYEKPDYIPPEWLRRLQGEQLTVDSNAAYNPEGVTVTGNSDTVLQDDGAQVTYDLGAYYVGFVGFEVTGKAGQTLELAWGSRLSDPGPTARPRDGSPTATYKAMHYVLRDGKQEYLGFPIRSLRYLRIALRGQGSVRLHRLWLTEYRLYAPGKGEFRCSDPDLNRIYKAAGRTAALTTLDVQTEDTDRERQGWFCGNNYWVPLTNYAMFGEYKIPRYMLQMAVDNSVLIKGAHPLLPTWCGSRPSEKWDDHLRDCALWAVLQVPIDKRFTGNPAFVRTMLPRIRIVLNSFELLLNKEGLVELMPGQRSWIDHSTDFHVNRMDGLYKTTRICVSTNAMYVKTLREVAMLERRFGDKVLAARYEQRAETVRDALNRYSGDGPFYPLLIIRDNEGNLGAGLKFLETTQYYAMWAQIPSKERAGQMWSKLRGDFVPILDPRRKIPDGLIPADCPYSFFQRIEGARGLGDYEAIILSMKEILLPMLDNGPGTFWEWYKPWDEAGQGILSGTGAYLMENFLGIHIGLPLKITPNSGGMLRWCKGYMTTPKGQVDVHWNWQDDKYSIVISLPKKMTAEVSLPDEAKAVWQSAPAKTKWNQSIRIKGTTSITVEPGQIRIDK